MKTPHARGSPIDMRRFSSWTAEFSGYRHAVNENRIDRWLKQFRRVDRDLAARLLDCVDFISSDQITAAYHSILLELPGWSNDERVRTGKWQFVAFSGSAGESGDTMLHRFRLANNLSERKFNDLFIHLSDLLRAGLRPDDTVVLVDDFSGTGDQVCKAWHTHGISELFANNPRAFLALVAAGYKAVARIRKETGLIPVPHIVLGKTDSIFSDRCQHFTANEKATLLRYAHSANQQQPKGYGDCGFVTVLAHRCPNNTIPILHAHHARWEGLFRRHD